MRNLIWIASYPKSGNTWLRILLDSALNKNGAVVDINEISFAESGFLGRQQFDEFLEFDSSYLNIEETRTFKKKYFENLSAVSERDTFIKTHDANIALSDHSYLIPENNTKLAIYVVRNPLDNVASLANHHGITIDEAIAMLLDKGHTQFRSPKGITSNVDQFVSSWACHVLSWLDSNLPLFSVRYEDMLENPEGVLSKICHLLGQDITKEVIRNAIDNNSFEILKEKEATEGFKEKSFSSNRFFRRGKAGGWKNELTRQQAKLVIKDQKSVMKRLGYFSEL
jgi:hypothetical protein